MVVGIMYMANLLNNIMSIHGQRLTIAMIFVARVLIFPGARRQSFSVLTSTGNTFGVVRKERPIILIATPNLALVPSKRSVIPRQWLHNYLLDHER